MYQKILVPLDGSDLSGCALEHVRTIAKGCNVPAVVLLNVETPIIYAFGDYDVYLTADVIDRAETDYKAWANGYLDKMAKELQKEGINARGDLLEGNVAENILDYAVKNGVDLIIMSTHGRSGPARWALGSVADRVIRHSTVPVMAISPPGCR